MTRSKKHFQANNKPPSSEVPESPTAAARTTAPAAATPPLPAPKVIHPRQTQQQQQQQQQQFPPSDDFTSTYLARVTTEFADDIDKLRQSSDFKDGSVAVLIRALRQGAVGFREEEREVVMMRKGGV